MKRHLLVFLPVLFLIGCRAQLHHGLNEMEANGIQNALREHGIEAEKIAEKGKRPTWAIEVDEHDAVEAQRILAELELPRPRLEGLAALADSSSVVPTPTEEHLKKVKALSDEVALTLQSVDGVTSARVLLALPVPSRPGQAAGVAKASAFLRVKPGALEKLQPMKDDLASLVAGSVEGLSPDQVAVVLQEMTRTTRVAPVSSPVQRLRVLLTVLAVTVCGLALGLVALTLRLRSLRKNPAPAPTPLPQTPRAPVVSPSATRKVA